MRPVHQPAEIVPLIHPSHDNPVTQTERNAFCEINIMRDQQRLVIADVDDKTLVARVVFVIRQQALNEAGNFDPLAFISLGKCSAHKKSTVGRP